MLTQCISSSSGGTIGYSWYVNGAGFDFPKLDSEKWSYTRIWQWIWPDSSSTVPYPKWGKLRGDFARMMACMISLSRDALAQASPDSDLDEHFRSLKTSRVKAAKLDSIVECFESMSDRALCTTRPVIPPSYVSVFI